MRQVLSLILLSLALFLPTLLFAQESELDKFALRQAAFGQTIPQEKVYVHMDNTCYFQGDTIWFSAYTQQTNTAKPSEVSGVLYVELLNNDGYLVERKLIEMTQGRGNGFFALNNQIQYSGFYELRAYTRWQLNWGEYEHKHPRSFGFMFRNKEKEREYFRDYDKLYSRVFPVYDKPLSPGDYIRDMTMRVMRREFKNNPDKRELKLSLFPEGGNLIAGVENRVAFEVAMSDGEEVEGILTIGSENVKTKNRGRGVFTIVPEKGTEKEVTFIAANGEKVSATLPQPEVKGVAIKVTHEEDSIAINMTLADLNADSLGLTLMHEGRQEKFHALSDGLSIKIGNLAAGIHQVTVFNTQGRVWADRLFFVTKPEQTKPTLTIIGEKGEIAPYERVELKIEGKAKNTPISLSVRDNYQTDPLFDNGNIMTEMLLCSEVKGFIPNPGWFFEEDDDEHREALDLLMMTQGWRRFVWRDMAVKGEWDLTQPNEKYPILMGEVFFNPNRISYDGIKDLKDNKDNVILRDYKYFLELARKDLTSSLLVHAELINLYTNETVVAEEPYRGNKFKLPLPKFYDDCVFFLSVADTVKWEKKKKDYVWIQMAGYGEDYSMRVMRKLDLEEADFRAYISWPYPRFVKPYGFYQTHLPPKPATYGYDIPAELLADSTKALREVTVTARRRSRLKGFNYAYPAFMVDAYDAWNTIEDAGVPIFDYKKVGKAMARVYLNDYGVNEEKDGNGDDRIYTSLQRRTLTQDMGIPYDSLYHPKFLSSVDTDVTTGKPVNRTSGEFNDIISGKSDGMQNSTKGRGTNLGEASENSPHNESGGIPSGDNESNSTDAFSEFFGGTPVEDPRFLIDKYVVYTDYQPRLEGSTRYMGSNRPETRIMIYPFYDNSMRPIYRDRRYILEGFSYPAEFYHPDYSKHKLPEGQKDYRRTLYWNPNLQLDENGEANITFYNNSRQTSLSIDAEGQSADGTLLWGVW
ncbi:MAG: hypothetical protein II240_05790 [Bacteroidaceae bacterium]|nr:hypothetical protein [Bacteroidaceae bacterium]